jgi:hypothetical protein
MIINGEFSGTVQEFSPDYCNYSNRLAGGTSQENAIEAAAAMDKASAITTNLFPNPSDGIMTLQLSSNIDESTPVSLLITDITGRIVLQKEGIVTAQTPIEGGELANGTYYYQVVKNNEVIGNGKIVIAK